MPTRHVREMEDEARHYWVAMSRAWEIFKTRGILDPEIDECREEIEAICMHTEWPLLRMLCQRVLARDDEWRMVEVRKARGERQRA